MNKLTKTIVIVPLVGVLLYAIYPVLALYAFNVDQLILKQLYLPLIGAIGLGLFFFLIFFAVLKKIFLSSIASMVLLVLFWNYSLIYSVVNHFFKLAHWHLIPILVFLYIHIVFFISRNKYHIILKNLTYILTIPISLLVLFNLIIIVPNEFKKSKSLIEDVKDWSQTPEKNNEEYLPDIYFLIFDELASLKTIEEDYQYNNDKLSNNLKDLGYFIINNSKVATKFTTRNLPELLNLQRFSKEMTTSELMNLYYNNYIFDFFYKKGYKVYFLDGWNSPLVKNKPDYVERITYNDKIKQAKIPLLNEFYLGLFSQSILYPFESWIQLDKTGVNLYDGNKAFFHFLKKEVSEIKSPKLVFAHIISPHSPFVFDRKGNLPDYAKNATSMSLMHLQRQKYSKKEIKKMYLEQYIYVSTEILNIAESINEKNEHSIILMQSDHGPRTEWAGADDEAQSLKVFNAIYFPDGVYNGLHDSISPVNTLKVLLNKYFGKNYKLLEDN